MRVPGTAIAWWYLSCGAGHAHCFVAVFVHSHRDSLMVEIAEGKSSMSGFPKDDHIEKPGWDYAVSSKSTQRQALARALSYAHGVVESRIRSGFKCTNHSFSETTGTEGDAAMKAWEGKYADATNLTLRGTPAPDWWPRSYNVPWMQIEVLERRDALSREGYDLVQLVNSAPKVRRKKQRHGRVYRRVGRFIVYAKGT